MYALFFYFILQIPPYLTIYLFLSMQQNILMSPSFRKLINLRAPAVNSSNMSLSDTSYNSNKTWAYFPIIAPHLLYTVSDNETKILIFLL